MYFSVKHLNVTTFTSSTEWRQTGLPPSSDFLYLNDHEKITEYQDKVSRKQRMLRSADTVKKTPNFHRIMKFWGHFSLHSPLFYEGERTLTVLQSGSALYGLWTQIIYRELWWVCHVILKLCFLRILT